MELMKDIPLGVLVVLGHRGKTLLPGEKVMVTIECVTGLQVARGSPLCVHCFFHLISQSFVASSACTKVLKFTFWLMT